MFEPSPSQRGPIESRSGHGRPESQSGTMDCMGAMGHAQRRTSIFLTTLHSALLDMG